MKAIVYENYGSPDVLEVREIPPPIPKDNEVLVNIKAASINSWDWDMVRGAPVFVRMWGLFKPKFKIPGADIAGIVKAVGKSVKKFKPGDEVFGDLCESGWGGYAEYTCANENALAIKSPQMSFEQAAATPQAGLMALQSIIHQAHVSEGQKVLINGAGGGVGTFAVQLAKSLGAEVTAVDSVEKFEILKTLGADSLINYKTKNFREKHNYYDLIIDVVANGSLSEYRRSLCEGGKFIMIGGTTPFIFKTMLLGRWMSKSGSKKLGFLPYKPNYGLDEMNNFFNAGKVVPVIDKCFRLEEIRDAFRYYAQGNVKGKIVITI